MITGQTEKNHLGYVFDIQGWSVHDGPGCRTLIFLNGCSLHCFWCSNPEGISSNPPLLHYASKCILCGNCQTNCSLTAISIEGGQHSINRLLCADCQDQACLQECYTDAIKLGGYDISVEDLMKKIQRDRPFWGENGGITLTGGEPLWQIGFATSILDQCHASYIHTAIETCGNIPWSHFQQVIPYTDWIFFDLKQMESARHQSGTGSGNELILNNAQQLARQFPGRLIFRLPLIPGFNDSKENIESTISFITETGRDEIQVLPLHHLGREKYPTIGLEYQGTGYPIPTQESIRRIQEMMKASQIQCYIGSEAPY